MNVKEYISNDFRALSKDESTERAMELFQKYSFDYLPVVDNGILISCLSVDLCLADHLEENISSYIDLSSVFFVDKDQNLLDALKIAGKTDSNIIPVCGEGQKYFGYITQNDIVSYISNTAMVEEIGGVLLVRKSIKEFSISEIAKIAESENAKVYGVYVSEFINDDAIITLKVNQIRLSNIEAALQRFGYSIVERYHENKDRDNLEDRYRSLMRYLDM